MARDKRSFFEKLTGAAKMEDYAPKINSQKEESAGWVEEVEEDTAEGQLTVDVYQTPSEVIIKTIVAGVRPEDLDITITRDMVTIKGHREGERTVSENDYFHRELYWGSFSRTVMLPQEVDVEDAEAVEKHGLLIVKLPKINKDRQTRLKVKAN